MSSSMSDSTLALTLLSASLMGSFKTSANYNNNSCEDSMKSRSLLLSSETLQIWNAWSDLWGWKESGYNIYTINKPICNNPDPPHWASCRTSHYCWIESHSLMVWEFTPLFATEPVTPNESSLFWRRHTVPTLQSPSWPCLAQNINGHDQTLSHSKWLNGLLSCGGLLPLYHLSSDVGNIESLCWL